MVTPECSYKNEQAVHNVAQRYASSAVDVPASAVPLAVLKTAEEAFQNRGFLRSSPNSAVLPLWFLGETERNVFLWRNGLSLDDASRFEFWIDVPSLIEKQLSRTETKAVSDGFFLPLWTTSDVGSFEHENARAYSKVLDEVWQLAGPHLHALSAAAREVAEERSEQRPIVVLPLARQVDR